MPLYLGSTKLSMPAGWEVWAGGVKCYPESAAAVALVATANNIGPINSTTWSVAKPAGALAGDTVVILVSANSRPGLAAPAGFDTVSLQTTTFDTQQFGVFSRVLDGTEGATFSAALGVSAYNNWVAQALLLRGADSVTPVAANTTAIADASHTGSFNVAAPSVNVPKAGSMLLFAAATDINVANAGATTYTAPAGFTAQGTVTSDRQVSSLAAAIKADAAVGASGIVTGSVTVPGPSAYMGVLLAITPPVTHPMAITGTLPAAREGVAYNATLTIAGDYVAPVTVAALARPAWMTMAVSGGTITFGGTPSATAAAVAFDVTATDANAQTATSAQSVAVLSAATYATLSATRKAANITLGSPAVTASTLDSGATGTVDVAACVGAATANRYWEVAIAAKAGASVTEAGIASSTLTAFGSVIGTSGDVNSMGLASNGTFYREWGGTAKGYTYAEGDTLTFWLKDGALYIGTVAGGWFGGSTGGVPTTPMATGITGNVGPAYSSVGSYGSNRAWAFNFGQSAWAGTPPAGATGWTV